MNFLVTGGAGFIGTNLCIKLLNEGHRVLCLDDLSTGVSSNIKNLLENERFEFFNHDLTKPFFPDKVDAIFNLASPASPVHYQFNPIRTLKMGTLAIYNVLGMASRLEVPLLQASTSEVYGDPTVHPQRESYWGNVNPIGPRACYDEGKRVAEALCRAYQDYNGVDIRIARIFNTYGPYMHPTDGRVITNLLVQSIENKPLTIYGDGSQTRSFCYVDDLVDGLFKLLMSDYTQPVNLGNPSEIKIIDLVKIIESITKKELSKEFKDLPEDDPKRRCPDISLAKEKLNWSPKVEFKQGLSITYDWLRKALSD